MGLITLKDIFSVCNGSNAVGAFNVHNLEFINGVIKGAEKTQKPTIMMINESVLKYGKIEILGNACLNACKCASVNMAVMVDHGKDIEFLKKCIDSGLDVMYDGSAEAFEVNVARTAELSEYAHMLGRSIEGEIGALGMSEDGDEELETKYTSVNEAVEFVKRTGIDVLAISVGNVHGFYKGKPNINVERIGEISSALNKMPIVMHGGSDIPYETIKRSILAGIKKFNIATDLKQAYGLAARELCGGEHMEIQPLKLFPVIAEKLSAVVEEKIKMFNLEL